MHLRRFALVFALLAGAAGALMPDDAVGQCQPYGQYVDNFMELYPTGSEVERFTGARGQVILERLFAGDDSRAVAFLYSGDGPVTGKRGRYVFLILDDGDCILRHQWIDGDVYDRIIAE
ncbi:MAG: hypothetical protein D6826_09125 [Alphaproteobacteria bacterium]|nr:MAG: hypothetical protein D6826_09125 [Alphaproteobacteria bacterium]